MLRFRVSGQGKRLFGDGFAFWVTDQLYPASGQLFGLADSFKGFAIIFDTFKNNEADHVHHDVSIIKGVGEAAIEEINKDRPGCDAAFRYHEKRADFDVSKGSMAKFTLKDGKFTVDVDAQGDGTWTRCFEEANPFPPVRVCAFENERLHERGESCASMARGGWQRRMVEVARSERCD